MQTAFSPWLEEVFEFGSLETGLFFFFVGGVSVLTQAVLLPRLSKKVSRLNLILYGITVFAVGLFVLATIQTIVFLFAVAALIFFGFGIQICDA
jgi:Na+/melibiose symporter-like transporter